MSDDLKAPSGPEICPKCGKQTTIHGKPFVEFEAYSTRCATCNEVTICGTGEWVQFPQVPCQQCVDDVEHEDCPCTSAQFKYYQRANTRAMTELRPIARQAHDAYMAQITPKMLDWRNHQREVKPTLSIKGASSGALAAELQARGWNVDSKVKRAPGRSGTLRGCPSIPMARELETRVGECVMRPEGAR